MFWVSSSHPLLPLYFQSCQLIHSVPPHPCPDEEKPRAAGYAALLNFSLQLQSSSPPVRKSLLSFLVSHWKFSLHSFFLRRSLQGHERLQTLGNVWTRIKKTQHTRISSEDTKEEVSLNVKVYKMLFLLTLKCFHTLPYIQFLWLLQKELKFYIYIEC